MPEQGASPGGRLILVARFGAAHGVRGEIRLISFTQQKAAALSYAPLYDAAGRREFRLLASRRMKDDAFVVKIEGVADRTAAEALTNLDLYAPREKLPAPDADEFYVADLIGLEAVDLEGAPLGAVKDVLDHGAGAILEIAPACGGETLLFPFTRTVVPTIDFSARRVVVAPPREIEAREDDGE
ncbi:ribosome maturation factor RimM [Methylocella sp.]|uniref:ribosome maturation factor RimM n=1 Tax=Methylocella sp. TaxID=1978226 RepID=UPI00378420EE